MELKQMKSCIQSLLSEHPLVQCAKVDNQEDTWRFKVTIVPEFSADHLKQRQSRQGGQLKGQKFCTLPNGLRIAHQSALQTNIIYPEIFDVEVYLRHGVTLSDGACVFDVGANIGLFTLFVYEKCHKDVCVYAFEPSPPTYEVLRKNVEILGMENKVKTFSLGLSSEPKKAPLIFFPHMSGMSGLFSNADKDKHIFRRGIRKWLQEGENEQEITQLWRELDDLLEEAFSHSKTYLCEFTTLSRIVSQHHIECIDLLKIDVEKSELEVLLGIQQGDWKKIRQIVAEVHNKGLLDQITDLLKHKGYSIVVEEEERAVSEEDLDANDGYQLYMVYAVRRVLNKHKDEEQQEIRHVTVKRPLLSVRDIRCFLRAKCD